VESPGSVNSSPNTSRITVHRRFSQFSVLHTALTRRLPGIALPPLPEKHYSGRFSDDFVEARRGDLERYLARIVRHPIARYAEILTFFLSCESEQEWKRQLPQHLGLPPAGPSFYLNVLHPDFNFDAEEATEAVNRFDVHTKAVDTGVQGLRNVFPQIRQARVEMSKAERLLSYSLLSLISAKSIATLPSAGVTTWEEDLYFQSDREDLYENEEPKKAKGYVNEQGSWCWREGCEDCLKLTKALQKTSETLQSVADLYDDHARRTQLITHESLKSVAYPSQQYAPIIDTHRNALSRYTEATEGSTPDEEVASRCETVLNTTMAEIETYHAQKVEDFASLAKEHLDGEIEFYEQVLLRLRTARRTFEPPIYTRLSSGGTRQPSIYERDLDHPRLNPDPLPQPCPHVWDATPMRPVSHAIQEGVGLLLGGAANAVTGRGSVFGRFW
jgi:sorting nexin-9/18/33